MSSLNIKVGLDQVWSITEEGFLKLEVTPKDNHQKVLGEFTFDEETILEDLKEDLENEAEGYSVDFLDWVNLKEQFKSLASKIDAMLETVS